MDVKQTLVGSLTYLELLDAILSNFRKDRVKSYEIYPKLKFGVLVLGLKCNWIINLRSCLRLCNLSYDYQNRAHNKPVI